MGSEVLNREYGIITIQYVVFVLYDLSVNTLKQCKLCRLVYLISVYNCILHISICKKCIKVKKL